MAQVGHKSGKVHEIYMRVPDDVRAAAASKMGNVILLADRRDEEFDDDGDETRVGTTVGTSDETAADRQES